MTESQAEAAAALLLHHPGATAGSAQPEQARPDADPLRDFNGLMFRVPGSGMVAVPAG